MFFRNRKRFNGEVDQKILTDYGIKTSENPDWPGVLAYLELLDVPWQQKWNADEAALHMVVLYYDGLERNGRASDALLIRPKILQVANRQVSSGVVGREKWERYQEKIPSLKG